MKLIVNQPPKLEEHKVYPYLGIHIHDIDRPDPMIVWFLNENDGILMCRNEGNPMSKLYSTDDRWNEESFVPFKGTITIRNED